MRDATPFGEGPRFEHAVEGAGIGIIHTPLQAPKANAIRERFLGSVQRECLDHVLILSARHLLLIMQAFVACFNHARPHQGIGSRIPDPIAEVTQGDARIIAFPVLGGLYHDYRRVT